MNQPLDAQIGEALALVIDGNTGTRRALANMLRDFGVTRIEQTGRPQDARGMLEIRPFDIVLCEHHFPGEPMNGQELMDDLRQAGVLPLSCVVVMISGEANYGHVAEAAEVALDAYLLKPHTPDALRVRLRQARERKRALATVFELINERQFENAAVQAEALVDARGQVWLQAARIAADLWLRLGRPADSERLLELVLQNGALPWARLGLARAQTESGAVFRARRTLESLITDLPGYTDAYDVLGRVLFEQGDVPAALQALGQAARITPHSVARQVKLGVMQFYFGEAGDAAASLAQAVRLGASSRSFDLQGLMLLAALQFEAGDARGLMSSVALLERTLATAPESPRLQRFASVLQVLLALLERRVVEALAAIRAMVDEIAEPSFDFEAGCNLLMLLARLDSKEIHLPELPEQVGRLASRFAVSRATCDLLCAALRAGHELVPTVRAEYERINAIAQQAVGHTVAGEPDQAATLLLAGAERTLNAKLMDLAASTIQRHRESIADADGLQQRLQALNDTYRSYGTQLRVARVDDPRTLTGAARPEAVPLDGVDAAVAADPAVDPAAVAAAGDAAGTVAS